MQEILLKVRYFEKGLSKYQKGLKNLILFFLLSPVPFDLRSYQK